MERSLYAIIYLEVVRRLDAYDYRGTSLHTLLNLGVWRASAPPIPLCAPSRQLMGA
jgi:hypothetical protein